MGEELDCPEEDLNLDDLANISPCQIKDVRKFRNSLQIDPNKSKTRNSLAQLCQVSHVLEGLISKM